VADDDDFWRAPAAKPGAVAAPRTVPAESQAEGAPAERGARARSQGLLTHVFRAGVVALAAVVLVATGLPYLSAKYQDSALAAAETDGLKAANRAAAARYLLPTDPGPYLTQARIYERAAARTLDERGPEAAGAVLDNLALAIGSYEKAISLEAADWTTHYHAGVAMLNLLMARGYIEGWETVRTTEPAAAVQNVLGDWSSLAALDGEPASPGLTPGSLAQDETTRTEAARFRAMTDAQLAAQTLAFLRAADERNPLASQVDDAITLAGQLTPPAGK
jgi:TPR repeat protein